MTTEGSQLPPHALPGTPCSTCLPAPSPPPPGWWGPICTAGGPGPCGTLGGGWAGKTDAEHVGDARGEAPRAHSPGSCWPLAHSAAAKIPALPPQLLERVSGCQPAKRAHMRISSTDPGFPRQAPTCTDGPSHHGVKIPKPAIPGLPLPPGRCAAVHSGGVLASHLPTPAGALAGSTRAPRRASPEGCLPCLGLCCVWASGGVLA